MTADELAIFAVGITVGVWLTCIVGMAIYAIAGREDVPVVTGAHSGDEDDDDWDDEGDDDWQKYNGGYSEDIDGYWLNDSMLMQRGRVDGE